MTEDETGAASEPVPKLTISQRLLTALPNLDRQKPSTTGPAGRGAEPRARSDAARHKGGDSGSEALEPDEVISPSGDAEEEGSQASIGASRQRERSQRPSSTGRGAGGNVDYFPEMSNDEITHAIKRIDDRERLYAIVSGPLGAAIGIALTVAAIHANPALGLKGHVADSTIWFEGGARVVFGAAVLGLAFTRRRSLVAFGLGFLGLTVLPFGVVFIGLAIWMLFRVSKYQKTLNARGLGPSRTRATQSPRAAARSGASDARNRARTRSVATRDSGRGRRQPEPAGPAPSRRYTPPKPTRPRPTAPS